jgi:hypothetical protein
MKQGDGRTDDIDTLPGQQLRQPRIAHGGMPPITHSMAKVFRDHSAKQVAVEEDDLTPRGAQPAPQLSTQSRLACTG